jgi:hypothetical protein
MIWAMSFLFWLLKKKMACSKNCSVSEIFRCDFCGFLSKSHIHYIIPSSDYKVIELFPISNPEFFLCGRHCGQKLSACLTACDLSNGIPYRVQTAYHPNWLNSELSSPNPQCFSCETPSEPYSPHVKAILTVGSDHERVFCRNGTCFRLYCKAKVMKEGQDWKLLWRTQAHGVLKFEYYD